jgi:membrane-bound lytic murein transglycosylase B
VLVTGLVVAAAAGVGSVVWADGEPAPAVAAPEPPTTTTTAPPTTTTTAPVASTTTAPPPPDLAAFAPPQPAGDPGGVAAQIWYAERALRDPATSPASFVEAALAQQVAYRQLGIHPEWDADVLANIPEDLRVQTQMHLAARREFRAMHSRLSTTLPAWRIVPPEPFDQLQAIYLEAEAASGVPWKYLAAIHLVETGTGRIRGTSSAGAQGPMQFLPATWAAYGGGGDINSTRDAILAAARYLARNGAPADMDTAIWNYNHSAHYVLGVKLYADLITEHPQALRAFYTWGIWYLTAAGDRWLPIGYDSPTPQPI